MVGATPQGGDSRMLAESSQSSRRALEKKDWSVVRERSFSRRPVSRSHAFSGIADRSARARYADRSTERNVSRESRARKPTNRCLFVRHSNTTSEFSTAANGQLHFARASELAAAGSILSHDLNETCGDPWPAISPRVAAAEVLRPPTTVDDNVHPWRKAATSADTPGPAAITAITCRSATSSRPPHPWLNAAVATLSPRSIGASQSTGRVLNPVTFCPSFVSPVVSPLPSYCSVLPPSRCRRYRVLYQRFIFEMIEPWLLKSNLWISEIATLWKIRLLRCRFIVGY